MGMFQLFLGNRSAAAPAPVVVVQPSGGYEHLLGNRRRTPEELREARRRFGIGSKEAEIIENVAARQIEDTRLDEAQRIQELQGKMRLAGLEAKTRHFEALAAERERLLNAEIARLMRLGRDNNDALVLIMLAAAQ